MSTTLLASRRIARAQNPASYVKRTARFLPADGSHPTVRLRCCSYKMRRRSRAPSAQTSTTEQRPCSVSARGSCRRTHREDIGDLVHFAVVQPGDKATDLERSIGFSIFQNPADGSRQGEPDWQPGWEWLQEHEFAYELCFIMDDSGFGHVVIVPKEPGIDPSLLNLCAAYAPAHA